MLSYLYIDSSEQAIARMKNLDECPSVPVKLKDVNNTVRNNQVKFSGGAVSIPADQMKCNILKARVENNLKNGMVLCLDPLTDLVL